MLYGYTIRTAFEVQALQFLRRETAEIQRPDDACWDDIHAREAAGAAPADDKRLQLNPGDENLRAYEIASFSYLPASMLPIEVLSVPTKPISVLQGLPNWKLN